MEDYMENGSGLYLRQIAPMGFDNKRDALMHKVWDPTPWMVDAHTHPPGTNGYRLREIMDWCRKNFGPESLPLHGRTGDWHMGSATISGYTWIGFKTRGMMEQFVERWGQGRHPESMAVLGQ